MASKFKITFFFTSTSAYGDSYTHQRTIEARNLAGAESVARIIGFKEFGARFSDNCYDWKAEALS